MSPQGALETSIKDLQRKQTDWILLSCHLPIVPWCYGQLLPVLPQSWCVTLEDRLVNCDWRIGHQCSSRSDLFFFPCAQKGNSINATNSSVLLSRPMEPWALFRSRCFGQLINMLSTVCNGSPHSHCENPVQHGSSEVSFSCPKAVLIAYRVNYSQVHMCHLQGTGTTFIIPKVSDGIFHDPDGPGHASRCWHTSATLKLDRSTLYFLDTIVIL